ncbi:cytochrome c oxidase subunit II [Halobacteriales archaeon QS_5_70_15]|nr:MAG: cytochrome c oxidase subunit II [Halobacteriales archaeon QS_5_70_15]
MITGDIPRLLLQGGLIPRGTRVDVFNEIYVVFVVLGTLVGVIVLGYMLWNAYKYRDGADREDVKKADGDRPTLGELPEGGGGGRKLFLSFGLSTVVVVSLIVWTYGTLLYVEGGAAEQTEEPLDVEVVGFQFGWKFTYPNGQQVNGVLRVPADRPVRLTVTSEDVFHNFGIPSLRVKTDAIPGTTTESWFVAEEPGNHTAQCFELCGTGHSAMNADVIVMEPSEYQEWYAGMNESSASVAAPEASGGGPA